MKKPYEPPESELGAGVVPEAARQRRQFWLRVIWLSLLGVLVPPMFGIVRVILSVVGQFGELSQTGEADPADLAGEISVGLLSTMWGLMLSAVSLIVLVGAVIRFFTLPRVPPLRPE